MKICHFADVHWRSLTRHNEYREAFNDAYNKLSAIKPDAIVICGDIVHNKTQSMTPELVDELTLWFRNLANISNVYVILGNHDMNISNLSRQDAISPIINAINDDRITLYKKSGVYKFKDNVNWCVFSLADKATWYDIKPIHGDINIALFHGSVAGSVTDQEWELEADITVKEFEQFDFVMLGDIHLKQALAYRDGDVSRPWIMYCGSTIMQSYGETPGKGFLEWDITTRDDFFVKFHEIKHTAEFHTIDWAGSVDETLKNVAHIPLGSRIRIRSDSLISSIEAKHITNQLLSFKKATEVIFKDEKSIDVASIRKTTTELSTLDTRNVDSLISLYKQQLQSSWNDDLEKQYTEILKRYIETVAIDDSSARHVRWSLKELSFNNTFGYAENNNINFRNLHGITGVFGPNRIGKSSFIGTMLYALYNGTDRGSIKNLHIINAKKQYCDARAIISIAGIDYMIDRQSVKHESRNGKHSVTSLNFAVIDEKKNVINDLNGEQRTDTEKLIRSYIGTIDDCMLTAIATQGDLTSFVSAGSSYRDQVMSKFLDLTVFEKFAELAKNESAALKLKIKNVPNEDWNSMILKRANELKSVISNIAKYEDEIATKNKQLDDIKKELAEAGVINIITQSDIDNDELKIKRLYAEIDSSKKLIESTKTLIINSNNKKDEILKKISEIDIDALYKKKEMFLGINKKVNAVKQQLEKEKQILLSQQKSVLKLNDVPCGDMFPNCKYIKDSYADKANLQMQKELVDSIVKEISELTSALELVDSDNTEKQLAKHLQMTSDIMLLNADINNAVKRIDALNESLSLKVSMVEAAEKTLSEMRSKVVNTDFVNSINLLKRSKSQIESELVSLDSARIKLATKKGLIANEIISLKNSRDEYAKLKQQWVIYDQFISASSKQGIPATIVKTQLPLINSEINKILNGVVDYTIRIEKVDQTTEIYIDYAGTARLIELASGMEKMIASIAIRVALQHASSLPKPDFFIIDEGFGVLDDTNIEACSKLLLSLKQFYKHIIVISHVTAIKDIADNVIDIVKIDDCARINFN